MPVQLVQTGVPTFIAQNVAFALPARSCVVSAGPNPVQVSVNNSDWSADVATSTTGGFLTAGVFVRCTNAAGTTVVAKPS